MVSAVRVEFRACRVAWRSPPSTGQFAGSSNSGGTTANPDAGDASGEASFWTSAAPDGPIPATRPLAIATDQVVAPRRRRVIRGSTKEPSHGYSERSANPL